MSLQQRMLDYRARENISQGELAKRAGVTTQTINAIERNRQDPSSLTKAKIERIVGRE